MSLPLSKTEFADFCLRQLGKGQINIEVTDEQIDDAIEMALKWFIDYGADFTERVYYKHQITDTNKTNKYIPIPDNIVGISRVFPMGEAMNNSSMFSIRYQIALNDLYTLTNVSIVPYFMTMQHLRLIEEVLVGVPMYRYTKTLDRCYIDIDWSTVTTGSYLLIEAIQVIDPSEFPQIWQDQWLIKYTTALIKKQWGSNTKKYGDMRLPGGAVINGQIIYDEALAEIKEIKTT